MSTPAELRAHADELEKQAAALRSTADRAETEDPTPFFQPGHTYQSAHIRMGEAVWLFRCTEVNRRHNGDQVAHGPGYWGDNSGNATPGTGRMTVTYTADSWSGGWTDIVSAESPTDRTTEK